MAHTFAGALQQAGWIRQRCAVKEPHVDVRGEYIDIAEGCISQTCNRIAVMQKLPYLVPALSHHLKPLMRDGSQFTCMFFHPRIDGGIPLDSAVESQQFRSHRRSTSRSATTNSQVCPRTRTDLRVHEPPLSEEFVYLSLAAEMEPEGRRFAGTLESAGVFSHGILRATGWFQGATLSSYSMGWPKPSGWTPSWRRASKAINRRWALNVIIWAKTPPNVKVSAGSHRASTNVSSQAERFRTSLKIRCSSASVFSSLCSIACGERCDLGGPFLSISAPDSAAVQTSFVKTMFSNSCLRVLFDSRQGSSSTTVFSGRSNCSSVKVPAYSSKRRVCQESLPAKRSNKSMSLPPFVDEP